MIRKIDQRLMAWMQNTYLWLLDETGIFIATVDMLVTVVFVALGDINFLSAFILLFRMLIDFRWYMDQGSGNMDDWNNNAVRWRENKFRIVFFGMSTYSVAINIITYEWTDVIRSLMSFLFLYLWTVQIREKHQKEEEYTGVVEGSSS